MVILLSTGRDSTVTDLLRLLSAILKTDGVSFLSTWLREVFEFPTLGPLRDRLTGAAEMFGRFASGHILHINDTLFMIDYSNHRLSYGVIHDQVKC
jgi:hypothetical protein